ncbi:hypothetical protein SAY87_010737 [Trapa incisa]|uniref:Protein MULTIPLE CHLOROPLAST DIVISION SITE 1 n=1 Tax=Trapa incisa TaxID=236973 RepID=A0AAN7GEL4_9MYRT|nr:hypothetical protein SAY87_010737 [Trapa incisa]
MTPPRFRVRCQNPIPSMLSLPSTWILDSHPVSCHSPGQLLGRLPELRATLGLKFGLIRSYNCGGWLRRNFLVKLSAGGDAVPSSDTDSLERKAIDAGKGDPFGHLRGVINSLPPVIFVIKRNPGANFVIGFCMATAIFFIIGRVYAARKALYDPPGSVADLVRRGQLRSDRRGISKPLKYEDPFNNPLVKVGKKNSTVEMCGKVYRMAPITLTNEEQAVHRRRRSRAYQWKRPTVFLREGDTIPPDVDADAVQWIPANHPFATTSTDIDEDLAQTNVYQKHGVPFRIQAEHEALQRKLEALQSEEKLDKLVIDRGNVKDFEQPLKFQAKSSDMEQSPPYKSSKSEPLKFQAKSSDMEQSPPYKSSKSEPLKFQAKSSDMEQSPPYKSSKSDYSMNSSETNSFPEETQKT